MPSKDKKDKIKNLSIKMMTLIVNTKTKSFLHRNEILLFCHRTCVHY